MTRDEAILSLKPAVRYWVGYFCRKLPMTVEMDDLASEAWIGAIKAVDAFRPRMGATLGAFARPKIRGRIQDYLRSQDWIGRAERRKIRNCPELAPVQVPLTTAALHADLCDKSISDALNRAEIDLLCRRLTPRQALVVGLSLLDLDKHEIARRAGIGSASYAEQFVPGTIAAIRRKVQALR